MVMAHMRPVSILLAVTASVFGCECALVSQPQAFGMAKAVFDGVVLDIHHFENAENQKVVSRVLVKIRVNEYWKGDASTTINVHAWERAIMCDSYKFELGKRYIVYAIEQDKENGWADQYPKGTRILALGACILRIAREKDVPFESKLLGKGQPPKSE
jgi:hypothetical protein